MAATYEVTPRGFNEQGLLVPLEGREYTHSMAQAEELASRMLRETEGCFVVWVMRGTIRIKEYKR